MDIDSFIKERIKALVTSKEVALKAISELLGYNRSYLSNILNGDNLPSFSALAAICDYFGITMSEFFAEEKEDVKQIGKLYRAIDDIVEAEDVDDLTAIVKTLKNENIKDIIASYKSFGFNQTKDVKKE